MAVVMKWMAVRYYELPNDLIASLESGDDMRIELLRECIDLAKTLNFTKTSKNMFVAQPALSKHVKAIESELGFALFQRTKRAVSLTKAGEVFVEGATRVVSEYDNMLNDLQALRRKTEGSLRIGYLQGMMAHDLPKVQSMFSSEFPNVDVDYITYEFNDILKKLEEDRIDVAAAFVPHAIRDASHEIVPFFEDEYCAVVNVNNPLSQKESISPGDLAGHTVSLPASTFYTSDNEPIIEYLNPSKNLIDIKEQVRDMNSLFVLVEANDTVGISFHHLKRYYGRNIALVPLEGFDMRTTFGAIWKQPHETEAIRRWAQISQKVLSERRE